MHRSGRLDDHAEQKETTTAAAYRDCHARIEI
jgi:hypothetical protein